MKGRRAGPSSVMLRGGWLLLPRRRPLARLISFSMISLLLARAVSVMAQAEEEDGSTTTSDNNDPCAGGACPATQLLVDNDEEAKASILMSAGGSRGAEGRDGGPAGTGGVSSAAAANTCEIWMAPSPIKKAEEQGFGLGMFTGRYIRAGTVLEDAIFGSGELLVPIYGSATIYETHPPLREYVWDEDMIDEVAVEDPSVPTALFMPGLAALAPCTANEFNLKLSSASLQHIHDLHDDVHRFTNPVAGGIAYKYVSYEAVRDIFPGEELTVQCSDDNFYGGNYFLSRYQEDPINGATMCLDHLQVRPSSLSSASTTSSSSASSSAPPSKSRGKGLFLKDDYTRRSFTAGATIMSTPVVPIHRKDLDVDEGVSINNKQLLLNYCYGHEHSEVLLLPVAPMINALNHDGIAPNAKLVWHQVNNNNANNNNNGVVDELHRRQQYHHTELLSYDAAKVVITHGMSLAVDVVATRTIRPGEEITIDYGSQWKTAWEKHVLQWRKIVQSSSTDMKTYQTADQFWNSQPDAPIRTSIEQERNPYPVNIEIFCDYTSALEGRLVPASSSSSSGDADGAAAILYATWNGDAECLRPCTILDRRPRPPTEPGHDEEEDYDDDEEYKHDYTVRLHADDNERILPHCLIETDVILTRVPDLAIHLLDRPYTSDVFLPHAFRHEIHVDFLPPNWMRQKLRRPPGNTDTTQGDEFKRKPVYQPTAAAAVAAAEAQ